MKVLYSSKTGNTKKIAFVIANELDVEIYEINSSISIIDDEILFVGFWVDKGEIDEIAKDFLLKTKDKKIALFFTAGIEKEHEYVKEMIKKYVDYVNLNNEVLGCFMSQGKISDEVIAKSKELALKNPDNPRYAITEQRQKRWDESAKHPNKQDLKSAINFANNIVNKFKEKQ